MVEIESLLPTCVAILTVILYTKQTRSLCYLCVTLCITTELMLKTINVTAVVACLASLAALLLSEGLRMLGVSRPFLEKLP